MEEPTVRRLLAAVNRYSHEKSKISIVPHRKPYTVDPEGNPGAHFLHDTSRTRPPTGPRPRGCAPLTPAGGYAWIHIHTPEPDFFGSTSHMPDALYSAWCLHGAASDDHDHTTHTIGGGYGLGVPTAAAHAPGAHRSALARRWWHLRGEKESQREGTEAVRR